MKIDAHQHFWKYTPERDTWIDDSMAKLQADFLPSDLKGLLEANSIQGCIAVQADQSEEETKWLLNLATENDFIKGVVGWVDLCADTVEERLLFFSKNPFFKGVRHIVQAEKSDFVLQEDFQNGIRKLTPLGLTYDLLVYPHQLEAATELVFQHPEQTFILDHLAKPNIKAHEIESWKSQIERISAAPNISCKLSGMVTEADSAHWKAKDFTPYLQTVFDYFGVERILFGSDWPVCLLAAEYKKVLQLVQDFTANLSKEEQTRIFGANACEIYNLTI
ncbi:MAG: amidohydrolase family protein [Flavobacteriaceae bacterium]|nr:amidohydrolase family protein [Flavobacteriaceae bacterium]